MLKKRYYVLFLAVLSFFVLVGCSNAAAANKFGKTKAEAVSGGPAVKMYMPMQKAEIADVTGKINITATKGAEAEAKKLFDENTSEAASYEKDMSVTVDMGREILLTQIVYYAAPIDKENGNNCLGTRFYASNDNKNYVELAVIDDTVPPENGRFEIDFGGFGEYRYFRINLPARSNISEVEFMTTDCFTIEKQEDGRSKVNLSVSVYDAAYDINATVLGVAYNKNGVIKRAVTLSKEFKRGAESDFNITLDKLSAEEGDSYRVVVFDDKGASPIAAPLVYRVDGASKKLQTSYLFGSNMIMQADKPAVVSGKAPRGSSVTVELESKSGGAVKQTAAADSDGSWQVNLGSFSAGGSYTMKIMGSGSVIKYKDITFGDVWLCTGQSNMDYYMMGGDDTIAELKDSKNIENENIRILNFWNKGIDGAASPVDNPPSDGVYWHAASSDTVAYCSAVGYYFARELQQKTDRPVGIVNVAVGDTEINRWISKGLKCGSFTSTDGDLYNNRIYPMSKIAFKGMILYQGEADQYRTHLTSQQYSDAMAGLVDSYRKIWGADLPFYWAQLARYKTDESEIREGQRLALSKVSVKNNTGMIVLNDITGNYDGGKGSCRDDIHPWNKKIVAERFARYALRDCYGENVDVSGPIFKEAKRSGNKMIVTFECRGGLKVMPKEQYADKQTDEKIKKESTDTSLPMEFEIAGSDKKFEKADAVIEGNSVILTSGKVKIPVYVRYAWGAYPEMPNLTDETGLPTATFTTESGGAAKN